MLNEIQKFNDSLVNQIQGLKNRLMRKQRQYKESAKNNADDYEMAVIETEMQGINASIHELEIVKCRFANLLEIAKENNV